MRRWVPALALLAVLTGCAGAGPSPGGSTASPDMSATPEPSASATPAVPVPRFIGPADDGSVYAMAVDQTTTLRTADAGAADPEVEGTAVLVIPTLNVAPGGGREWEVRAVEPGAAVLTGTDGGGGWTITLT